MFTVIGLFKRRPGMTMDEFINHYENVHAKLGAKCLPTLVEYKRRYLYPVPYPLDGSIVEAEYDVITEMTFVDRAASEAAYAALAEGECNILLSEDEENLFDKPKNRLLHVEEHSSILGSGR